MNEAFARNWWMLAVRGTLAIIVGLIALFSPVTTLYALVLLFGVYALLDGVTLLAHGFGKAAQGRGWLILEGIVGVVAAVAAFVFPSLTALALVYLIASWAIVTGVFELFAAFSLREVAWAAWSLVLTAVLSLILGVILLIAPGPGALAWVWVFGIYAIAAGVALLVDAFRLRGKSSQQMHPTGA